MKYIIDGPNFASGKITVSGAKNFSIKALAASILVKGKVAYNNLPSNLDVVRTLALLESIGADIYVNYEKKFCEVDTTNVTNELNSLENANMIMFLFGAALLHRFDFVKFPKNKGCPLGKREYDFHVMAFESFGAVYDDSISDFHVFRKKTHLKGCLINLPYPSVGATETAIFLAVLSNGMTKISNAAIEPEIQALVTAFISLGAQIFFENDRTIIIHGVNKLFKNSVIEIHGDLLEAATWAVLAAATKGEIEVDGIVPELIGSFLGIFSMMGGKVKRVRHDSLVFSQVDCDVNSIFIETGVFPKLRTDLQPLLAALGAIKKDLLVLVHETVYDKRLNYLESFKEFGINASGFSDCFGSDCRFHNKTIHSAVIQGVNKILAPKNPVKAKTIRCGMAEIILATVAHGRTIIEDVEVIERGYCNLFYKLKSLGIQIKKEE